MYLQSGTENWFALYVKPRHEKVVTRLLMGEGLEAFLPLYKRHHVYGARSKDNELPLFPGYVFCRFVLDKRTPVLATSGVISIVGIGKTPMPIDDIEIQSLQTAARARLSMEPCDFLPRGRRVRITRGALTDVEGVVLEVRNFTRLILSISLLQRAVQIEIDSSCVSECHPLPYDIALSKAAPEERLRRCP
jgi:transcription antitermination factor NusG